tara:strand:- start:10326 stop:11135 length:810 start_codon:yes stop_codon:yes gene_type:complete
MKTILCLFLTIVSLPATAAGLVSIDGALTEIIYRLGAGDRLVAVDTTSVYPQQAQQLPQVGYMRQLSAEGILSVKPDLVIASRDAGPEAVFEQLKAAGVNIVRIKTPDTVDGVADKIQQVADALEIPEKGQALARQVTQESRQVLAGIPQNLSADTLFLLGGAGRGLMAAGQHTRAQAFMDLVNANNVFHHQGYKPVTAEGALQAAPEFVLVGHTGPANSGSAREVLAMTPAAQNDRVHSVDVGLVLSFGPRLPQALKQVAGLLYPQPD